jgi:hypothetical protein
VGRPGGRLINDLQLEDTFSEMLGPVPFTHVITEFLVTVIFQFFGGDCTDNAHVHIEKWDGNPQPMSGLPVRHSSGERSVT